MAGGNDVQPLTLPANQMSAADALKLKQIIQFAIINEYCKRWLDKHPEVRGGLAQKPAAPGTPPKAGAPPAKTDAPPAPAAQTDPPKPATPTGAPTAAGIDAEIMNAVKNQIQLDINKLWKKSPAKVKEYIWGEGDTHEAGFWGSEWVGITGAIAFTNLWGQTISETPALGPDARLLKIKLESPGPLVVRMIVGGTLGRSGSWSNSMFDNLAVNIPAPTVTEDGPDNSIVVRIGTEWLWDDNTTVWDFAITIGADGTPDVQDRHSGKPKDSAYFAWWSGEGGKHQRVNAGGAKPKEATPGAPNSGVVEPALEVSGARLCPPGRAAVPVCLPLRPPRGRPADRPPGVLINAASTRRRWWARRSGSP